MATRLFTMADEPATRKTFQMMAWNRTVRIAPHDRQAERSSFK